MSFPQWWVAAGNGPTMEALAVGEQDGLRFLEFRVFGEVEGSTVLLAFATSNIIQAAKGDVFEQSFFLWHTGGDFTSINQFQIRLSERFEFAPFLFVGNDLLTVIANPTSTPTRYSQLGTVQNEETGFVLPRLGISVASSGPIDVTLRVAQPELRRAETLVFTDDEIISIRRVPTQFPRFQTVVGHSRNFTVDTGSGVADAAPDAFKAFARQEFRGSDPVTDTDVLLAHPRAGDIRIDTALSSKADADTEATRLNALHKVRRDAFEVVLRTEPFVLDLNTAVVIQSERHGLSPGKRFLNVELDEQTENDSVTLVVWG